MVTDRPTFWLGFVALEVGLPLLIPNKRWAGGTMLLIAAICFGTAFGFFPIPNWSLGSIAPLSGTTFFIIALFGNFVSCAIYSYRRGSWSSDRALIGTVVVVAAWLALRTIPQPENPVAAPSRTASATDVATARDKATAIACPPEPTPSQENALCAERLAETGRNNSDLQRQMDVRQQAIATMVQDIQKQDYIQQAILIGQRLGADQQEVEQKIKDFNAYAKTHPEGPVAVHSEPMHLAGEREEQDQRTMDKLKADFKHRLDSLTSSEAHPNK